MPLPIDYKIDKIYKQIQVEIKQEYGVDISYETICHIINQQIASTIDGMEHGYTAIWKYFGSFVASQKRVAALNQGYLLKGRQPGLVDSGLQRIAFHKNGEVKVEAVFSPIRKSKDLIQPNPNA